MAFKVVTILAIVNAISCVTASTQGSAALASWDAYRATAESCTRYSGHDREMCVCDNMDTPSKKQDDCYEKRARSYIDCLKISRTNQPNFDRCVAKNPQSVGKDWKLDIENCKTLPRPSDAYEQCFANVCGQIGENIARDQCFDSVSADCSKRSTAESRDACHETRRECKEIAHPVRKEACYTKYPNAAGNPNPRGSRPTPKQPAPSSPSTPANPKTPANPNQIPWLPNAAICNSDQTCYMSKQCDRISTNLDMKDTCYLEQHNCRSILQQIAKDYCYACALDCNSISNSTEAKDWKDGCSRKVTPSRCPPK